jgi:purine nucleoside phosphorylase
MERKKNNLNSLLKKSLDFIHSKVSLRPKIAIILGSGLGDFADSITDKTIIETSSIPYYPHSTVQGHKGNFREEYTFMKVIIWKQFYIQFALLPV